MLSILLFSIEIFFRHLGPGALEALEKKVTGASLDPSERLDLEKAVRDMDISDWAILVKAFDEWPFAPTVGSHLFELWSLTALLGFGYYEQHVGYNLWLIATLVENRWNVILHRDCNERCDEKFPTLSEHVGQIFESTIVALFLLEID